MPAKLKPDTKSYTGYRYLINGVVQTVQSNTDDTVTMEDGKTYSISNLGDPR